MSTPAFDYYRILGLSKDASFEDVRRAYKQKVLETHPDKLPPDSTEEEKEASHELFSRVHEASEILGNPDRRREYDIHYRELPDPSVKSAFSPKSSTVSMSRSDSVATVRTTGPTNVARTSSMVSSASSRPASKPSSDTIPAVSRTDSMKSVHTAAAPANGISRNNSTVTAPPMATRTNTISSSRSVNGVPSSISRANSSASARDGQDKVSRSNSSAIVRGAPPSPSVTRKDSVLSRIPSTPSNPVPPALPSVSRANSAATVRSSISFSSTARSASEKPKTILEAPASVSRSNSTSTAPVQPVSRSNSTLAASQPTSVSRSNSVSTVTALSLHESSSIVRSSSSATALTSVSARSKAVSNYTNRMSMATVTSAFSDLPTPPYSHPEDYEALVDAMLQELYRITPGWVERKQRLEEIRAQREAGHKIDSQAWRASWAS
ncbi:hypothetical protein EDB89DRAFT_1981606 [Lactarius sanguifluus]|nr:hypothetical protein EDB89DRAFT_1981606 [Lactarius sanguifluus]